MKWPFLRSITCVRRDYSAFTRCRRHFAASTRFATDHVRIVEVGARDGLQNEKQVVSLETKLELLDRLVKTGLKNLEAGSFVPRKWVPQMEATSEVLRKSLTRGLPTNSPIAYSYLVPNLRGMETLVGLLDEYQASSQPARSDTAPTTSPKDPDQVHSESQHPGSIQPTTEISLFTAASETFSQKNTNCSIQESLNRLAPILAVAKERNMRARGYVSVALGCPYEGPDVDPHEVARITTTLLEMGCDEVSVADTTGMGTAPRTRTLLKTLREAGIQNEDIALHFHDTYGQALVNAVVGLEHGVRTFDSSVAGLGGCPFSPGATGNVSTEDLLHLLHSLGLHTDVDLGAVAETGAWVSTALGRSNDSRAGKAILARESENR